MARSSVYMIFKNSWYCRTVIGKCVFQVESVRNLYSKTTLGVDGFVNQRENVKRQLASISQRFKEKMKQYSEEDSDSMIFTEDLKNMLHLAETDEDIAVVTKMMKKFNKQNKELRFGNFVFGPVVMRLFYILNKPDEALQCVKTPELQGFFDQLITYQILFDLLYENKKYEEMLVLFKEVVEKQIQGIKYPKNLVVLVLAACYKLNSEDSYQFAMTLWMELGQIGHQPVRRASTFCAGLALNQRCPGAALEIISTCQNQNYTTVRNLKVAALAELGRVEDCIPVLKNVLNEDSPTNAPIQTFNKDVILIVKHAVENVDSGELRSQFAKIEKYLQEQGHISEMTLDEQLCTEIALPRSRNQRTQFQMRNNEQQTFRKERTFAAGGRPGLTDIA